MGQIVRVLTQSKHTDAQAQNDIPTWVPRSVQNYIDHTEMGISIRALARAQGCHASTILRQIRRVETLRDDPLVDNALKTLGGTTSKPAQPTEVVAKVTPKTANDAPGGKKTEEMPNITELFAHGNRVLKRLCETAPAGTTRVRGWWTAP